MTKLPQEGQVGAKMGLHAAKEGRLETKRGHDGAKVHVCGLRGDGVGASGG